MRKNILITGASSGLGMGMAREYAKAGHHLALCARRLERLVTLKLELEGLYPGIRVLVQALDVNCYDDVFRVFRHFHTELGHLDRIIINAGIGKGQPIGTGRFAANRQTAETNFVAALAQCEAAVEILRVQNQGHLVTISSMAAVRGLKGNASVYAASKAGLLTLTEGIRADLFRNPIRVTCVLPGFIRSEINENLPRTPFMIDTEVGCKLLVKAIDRERPLAIVPAWPWRLLYYVMKVAPLSIVRRIG